VVNKFSAVRRSSGCHANPECFVSSASFGELQQLVSAHGYWVVALIVGLESMGLPLPGETILILAAIYAATEPSFNLWAVIAVAAFGAIVGDNAGYWLGLRYGYALLLRYGERIGMVEARIKLGQYLFLKHGAKVVFLGRFVALLRILAAFLAGVNRMPWRAFLIANASGGIIWATVFGIGGYFFGKLLLQLHHALASIVFAVALAAFFGCGYLVRRYEDRLTALAERALPGPLVVAVFEKRP
jgi:membrane protein DedA with SNARE-associated domain